MKHKQRDHKVRPPHGAHGPRGTARRVVRNSAFILSARCLEGLMRVMIVAVIARYLGVEDFGSFAFIMAFVAFVLPITDLGMQRIVVREISSGIDRASNVMGSFLLLRGILATTAVVTAILIARFTSLGSDLLTVIVIAAVAQGMAGFGKAFLCVFRSFERMGFEAAVTVVHQVARAVGVLVVFLFDLGFLSLFVALLAAELFYAAVLIVVGMRLLGKVTWSRSRCFALLRESYPLGIFAVIAVASFKVDVFVLRHFHGPMAVSLFEAPHRIVMQLQLVPVALVTALFPVMSRLAKTSPDALHQATANAFKFLLVQGFMVTTILAVWSEDFVALLFGKQFAPAAVSLSILSIAVCSLFPISLMNHALTSVGKQKLTTVGICICFLVNLVLDILLVPSFRYIGASIGTVVAYMAFFSVSVVFTWRNIGRLPLLSALVGPIACGSVAVGIAFLARSAGLHWTIGAPLAGLAYAGALALTRVYTWQEIHALMHGSRRSGPPPGSPVTEAETKGDV